MLACTRPPKQTGFIYATGHHEQDLPRMCYTQNHHQIHEYLICCPDEVLVLVPVKTVELIPSVEAAGHEDEEPARRSRHDHSHRRLRALKRLMQHTVMLGSINVLGSRNSQVYVLKLRLRYIKVHT